VTTAAPQPEAATAAPEPVRALARAESAFAHGDYAMVRATLAELESSPDQAARARAALLQRAISVDPALAIVLGACLIALCAIFLHYVGR
jgi:hypothetical protein